MLDIAGVSVLDGLNSIIVINLKVPYSALFLFFLVHCFSSWTPAESSLT